MTKKRMHWMAWDIPAYWADTRGFDAERHGAYMMLIGELWMRKGKPLMLDDPDLPGLAACTAERWAMVGPSVLAKFAVVDGALVQKRVDAEMEKAQKVSEERKAAGKKGGDGRWGKSGPDGLTRSERLAAARKIGTHTAEDWESIQSACGYQCVHCGIDRHDLEGEKLTKDHITQLFKGGSDGFDNLQPSCRNCNSRRGSNEADARPKALLDWVEKRMAKRPSDDSQNASVMGGQKQKQKQSPNGDIVGAAAPPPTAAPPAPPAPPESKATRLPKDWQLPSDWEDWAAKERTDLNIPVTADSFRDFWVAKSGKDATKLDWLATWRNWVRNQRRAFTPTATRNDARAATMAGLGTKQPPSTAGEQRHGTNRTEPIDVPSRVIPDAE